MQAPHRSPAPGMVANRAAISRSHEGVQPVVDREVGRKNQRLQQPPESEHHFPLSLTRYWGLACAMPGRRLKIGVSMEARGLAQKGRLLSPQPAQEFRTSGRNRQLDVVSAKNLGQVSSG